MNRSLRFSVRLVTLLVVFFCLQLHAASWLPYGPDGGDARAFAVDPHDHTHLYLGTATGWMYESRNGGADWKRIAQLMLEKKNLNANVDFYSATVYYSLGIPTDLFTPIFAISRTAGWTAHVLEQLADNRLIRPQSLYTGTTGLKVVPVEKR